MADVVLGIIAAAFAVFCGHVQAGEDRDSVLKVRDAEALYRQARVIGPDPGPQREHPAVEFAREYLEANRGRFALGPEKILLLGISSRRDPDTGRATYRIRFDARRAGSPQAPYEIEVGVRETEAGLRVVP